MMATRSDAVIWLVDELQRRLLRANLIGHGHAGQVEEQHQQAAVLVLDLSGFGRRDGVGGL